MLACQASQVSEGSKTNAISLASFANFEQKKRMIGNKNINVQVFASKVEGDNVLSLRTNINILLSTQNMLDIMYTTNVYGIHLLIN